MADFADLIPGGIQPGDVWHDAADHDGTCSRCRKLVSDHSTSLTLWADMGDRMLIYCTDCATTAAPADVKQPGDFWATEDIVFWGVMVALAIAALAALAIG